jgi:predicted permease
MDTPADIVLPARFDRRRLTLPGFGFRGLARLKPGVTLTEGNADVARMVPIWMSSWPAASGVSPRVYESWRIAPALRPLKDDVVGSAGRALTILMGSLAIVLLVACANVATLVLVRAEGRQQELAIRAALGAGRARILRALLVESALLGLVGGLLGLGVAYGGVELLAAYGPTDLPRASEIAIDSSVLLATLAASFLCGIVFGIVPALKHAAPLPGGALNSGGRTLSDSRERHRARDILVVAQLALALVLLVSSGLMIRSVLSLRAVQPGFQAPERLQAVRIAIPDSVVREPEQVARMQEAILGRLRAIAGVDAAAFASEVPLEGVPTDWDVLLVEGQPLDEKATPALRTFKTVSPAFFDVMGTRVIAGRAYTWDDLYGRRPYVVVSENLARELWGSPERAIGKRVHTLPNAPWREVIGVVQDVHDRGVDRPPPTIAYWPTFGEGRYRPGQPAITRSVTFVIRGSRAGTDGFIREVQEAVWSVNANLSFPSMRTMREIYGQSMARTSFTLVVVSIAGGMAMALGIIGIYGVVSYAVSQRRREIGIRVALGAGRTSLTGLFVRSGLALAMAGIPMGLLAAALLTRLMAALLFGVSALDPITFVTVPAILVAAAVLASYLPARRAASVNPVEALKGP